ncbi:MAG: hypothetical protein Q7S68_03345 [Deltaproteobacteria bacterium]|nr:hypothetical protein [Deltaproteobacteria bacterium]
MQRAVLVFLFWVIALSAQAAITFTGRVDQDFQTASCFTETSGQDVGMPSAFGNGAISGFDIDKVCLSYDPNNDTLYVGIQTFSIGGTPIIFGDADNNGDPATSSLTLQTLLGTDYADLGPREYFTFVFDMDRDNAPDLVVGTHSANSLSSFGAFAPAAAPNNNLLLAPLDIFYGTAIGTVSATLAHLPGAAKPHLEFSVSPVQNIPNYAALNFNNPDSALQIYIATGSFDDDGIAEETFPNITSFQKLKVAILQDADGDTINDLFDKDSDNDGVNDLIEKNLNEHDTDGDGFLSSAEATASGLDTDADGDLDTNDLGAWPDSDADANPDYLDTDSDGDSILDSVEAGSDGKRDSDGDGVYDFRETDSDSDGLSDAFEDRNGNGLVDGVGETSSTSADSDGDGLCDGTAVVGSCTGSEIKTKTDPNNSDTDGDFLCDGAVVVAPCVDSEGNQKTDPLIVNVGFTPTNSSSSASPTTIGSDVDLTLGAVRLQGGGCSFIPGLSAFASWVLWFFLFIWLGIAPRVFALRADHYSGSMDGLGTLNHESAAVMGDKEYSLSLSTHLSHDNLAIGRNSTGQPVDAAVNYFYIWNFSPAYSPYEGFTIGLNIPVSWLSQVEPVSATTEQNTTSMGDIRLQAKMRILGIADGAPFDFTAIPFVDFPSGEARDFYGEKNVAGGFKLAGTYFLQEIHEIGVNLGMVLRGTESIVASNTTLLEVGPEMLWSVAYRATLSQEQQWLAAINFWGKSDLQKEINSPTEVDFGLEKRFQNFPLDFHAGLGFGLNKGYGNPTYRLIFGMTYLPGKKK